MTVRTTHILIPPISNFTSVFGPDIFIICYYVNVWFFFCIFSLSGSAHKIDTDEILKNRQIFKGKGRIWDSDINQVLRRKKMTFSLCLLVPEPILIETYNFGVTV